MNYLAMTNPMDPNDQFSLSTAVDPSSQYSSYLSSPNLGSSGNQIGNQSNNIFGSSDDFKSGLGSTLSGIFGLFSPDPYKKAMDQYSQYMSPYSQMGQQGMQGWQDWIKNMKDPSGFINNLQNQYQESPETQFLKRNALLAAQNQGSAQGTTGSTALMNQIQQNASNIGQEGMDKWLNNVLGINSQYGQGMQSMTQMGQQAAEQMAQAMAQGAYGQQANKNMGWSDLIGGIGSLFGLL